MRFVRFLVWTSLAMGLGIFIASYEVKGRTPLEHLQRAWKTKGLPGQFDKLKQKVSGTFSDNRTPAPPEAKQKAPKETYSPEDRAAVNKLIAKRAGTP